LGSFRKFRLRFSLLLTLFQPHTGAYTVLIDEFDARYFGAWLTYACFELMHGHYADLSVLCQFLLVPFEQSAGGSAL
jgi:hypothetical protein